MLFVCRYIYYKLYLLAEKLVPYMVMASESVEAGFYLWMLGAINLFFLVTQIKADANFLIVLLAFQAIIIYQLEKNYLEMVYKMKQISKSKRVFGETAFWLFISLTVYSIIGIYKWAQ